jgi:flagellar hook-associated protein 2
MSDISRITGMVSGIDTDEMVEDLMQAEELELNDLEQEQDYLEWQQEAYREVINELRDFSDSYFSYTSSKSNLLSTSTFNSNTVNYNDQSLNSYADITVDSTAEQADYTISNLISAEKAVVKSSSSVSADIMGETITASTAEPIVIDSSNNQIELELNGENSIITISEGEYSNLSDLQTKLQTQINAEIGSDKLTVNLSEEQLSFSTDITNELKISAPDNSALSTLGFSSESNLSNRIDLDTNLADISENFATELTTDGSEGDISFTINDQSFSFTSATTSLTEIMEEVNSSEAGVKMTYDELNNTFSLKTFETGASAKIKITETDGNLFDSLNIDTTCIYNGSDASLDLEDSSGEIQTITRSNNSFSFNGMSIEINDDYSGEINFSVASDAEGVAETITSFVEDYNTLIEDLNSRIDEERDYDYDPLTDEEKEEMTDEEIEKWEKKAKSGVLEDESNIERMLSKMRTALYDSVESAGISLYEIGITTSNDYEEQGKLVIDEDELLDAIEDKPDQLAELFTVSSDNYEEQGLAQRLNEIIDSNVSTSTNSSGYKGNLLETAGLSGTSTEYNNKLTDQIEELTDKIEDQENRMSNLEAKYYEQFSAMESAISKMDTISSYLSSFSS